MTFLTGKIVDTPEGRGFATEGIIVPLAGYDGGVPAAGAEVILGVRPEHVSISTDRRAACPRSSRSTSRWARTA